MKKRNMFLAIISFTAIILINNIFYCHKSDGSGSNLLSNSEQSPLKLENQSVKAVEIQDTFRKIFELYKDSVVFITTEQLVRVPSHPFYNDPFMKEFFGGRGSTVQKRTGLGTGLILSKDGYICTNHHVINGVDKIFINIMNKTYVATIVGSDERTDIALLKVDVKDELKGAYFGNSDEVRVGDWAVAIGNPFGLDRTFTVGVISAIGRNDVDFMGGSHIQTDASINPGNSGGPLINIHGEVIGINRMIYSKNGGYMGIGFAIPINTAQSVLSQLKKFKKVKRGYLGISIIDLTERYASQLGLKTMEGALIGEVHPGSPADREGIRVGDVILKIDDKQVANYRDLLNKIADIEIGRRIKISLWRDRRVLNLNVIIAERP